MYLDGIYGSGFQYFEFRQHLSFEPVIYFWNEAEVTKEMLTRWGDLPLANIASLPLPEP